MKIQILVSALSLVLVSCASLTGTQIHAVNQFARTSKNFSAYPSLVFTELAEIRVKRGIYFANSLDDPKLHIEDLDGVYNARNSDYAISAKVDITFKVIDKYAQSLLLLSSDKHAADMEIQAKSFGGDLDSLTSLYNSIDGKKQLPTGIGGAIGRLVVFGGKQYIKSKQATEIKKFVPQADTLISVMTSNLLEFLESTTIEDLIKNEEKGITSNYLSFLRQRHATVENERDYIDLRNSLDAIKQLRDETIIATRHLRKAHKKLLLEIQAKKKLRETIAELQELYDNVKDINVTISTIKSYKK
ncbi:MAG: hypothetical protein ABIQ31_26035 [Ferruginibacter sp.]